AHISGDRSPRAQIAQAHLSKGIKEHEHEELNSIERKYDDRFKHESSEWEQMEQKHKEGKEQVLERHKRERDRKKDEQRSWRRGQEGKWKADLDRIEERRIDPRSRLHTIRDQLDWELRQREGQYPHPDRSGRSKPQWRGEAEQRLNSMLERI